MSIEHVDFVKIRLVNEVFLPFIDQGYLSLEELRMVQLWVPDYFLLKKKYPAKDIVSLYKRYLGFKRVSIMLEGMEVDLLAQPSSVH
ncbi:hypothetical protein Sps_04001 [Shewanella psychrophila]|uniref:Uncharacterized protein n=1 Tax=Shewanella psychrophila TaxID=225848 RepID=A0A1S6HU79_9GAMM|nr:hypothetical protein [Shewanella psychrophila]AQS39116.1 hypothetical protein Sps_04001 [Shewanella psychrophila]